MVIPEDVINEEDNEEDDDGMFSPTDDTRSLLLPVPNLSTRYLPPRPYRSVSRRRRRCTF